MKKKNDKTKVAGFIMNIFGLQQHMKWPIQGSLGEKNVYVSRLFDSAAVR